MSDTLTVAFVVCPHCHTIQMVFSTPIESIRRCVDCGKAVVPENIKTSVVMSADWNSFKEMWRS